MVCQLFTNSMNIAGYTAYSIYNGYFFMSSEVQSQFVYSIVAK